MNTKDDIDKQLLYVASPRPVISFEQSSNASRKLKTISGEKDNMQKGDNI
jgi:hypothetical protein